MPSNMNIACSHSATRCLLPDAHTAGRKRTHNPLESNPLDATHALLAADAGRAFVQREQRDGVTARAQGIAGHATNAQAPGPATSRAIMPRHRTVRLRPARCGFPSRLPGEPQARPLSRMCARNTWVRCRKARERSPSRPGANALNDSMMFLFFACVFSLRYVSGEAVPQGSAVRYRFGNTGINEGIKKRPRMCEVASGTCKTNPKVKPSSHCSPGACHSGRW